MTIDELIHGEWLEWYGRWARRIWRYAFIVVFLVCGHIVGRALAQ